MTELIYSIDPIRTEQDERLTIKIQEAERDGFFYKPVENQQPLTFDRLQKLATAKDSALLTFLINEEKGFVGKGFDERRAHFHLVHLSHRSTMQAFKLFAISGKLYFNGKSLVIDLYGKTEFYYSVDHVSGKTRIIGHLKTSSLDFPIHECDLVGRGAPHWYIKGINLKFIATDVPWKDLKEAFKGIYRSLDELKDDLKLDPEAPKILLNADIPPILHEPLPVLILRDRLGSFADLFLDYGENTDWISYHDASSEVTDRSGKMLCKRQIASEKGWEKDLLETDFIKKAVGTTHFYCPLDKVAKSLSFLLEIGWKIQDWKGNRVLQYSKSELNGETHSDSILIKGKMHYDTFEADLGTILGAFNRRERFAEIAPGHVALLPNSWEQSEFGTLVEEGEIIGDSVRIKRNQIGSLSEIFDSKMPIALDRDLIEIKEKLQSFKGIAESTPGEKFQGILRSYQQEGLNWLSFLFDYSFHGMLADDMGLGKTVQVLAFLSRLPLEAPILIVVPTSLIFNWKKEIERFLPSYPYTIHHGSHRTDSLEMLNHPQIILTTYTTLRLDLPLLSKINYLCLILDEAQAIKNAHTQTFQAVSKLSSRFRLSITGTPVENHLHELWSHFRFLIPDLFGEEGAFDAEINAGMSDTRYLRRIRRKIRPFLLRRTKEEVAKDLPEKIEQVVWIEMGEKQRAIYEEFLSGIKRGLLRKVGLDGASKHRMEILEAIMRLRQICCHPLLVNDEASAESAKLDALMEDLETAIEEGRKVLVYSQFTSMLALISHRIKEHGWKYAYLDGSTQNREKVVNQFQEDAAIPIFLISLKAGGIGLNLTAADYVFLYDPWWNNAVENQAIDRAHRIGRKETVIAKRYVISESIEEKMMKLKTAKSALAEDILSEDGQSANLTVDDLLFLLSES